MRNRSDTISNIFRKGETEKIEFKESFGREALETAMNYCRERLQTRFEMTGKPQRKVIWEYPLAALREAVVNAVCHRDYADNGHTQIRIYDSRLLVWNPGNLPDGLSVEMLKKDHRSIPRNGLIARVFFYAGLIEQWGSGMSKMIDEVKMAGLPAPVFEEKNGFRVTFSTTPHATPHAEGELNKIQEKVLKFCRSPKTRAEIVEMTGLSLDYIRKEFLPHLIERGKLVQTLPDQKLGSKLPSFIPRNQNKTGPRGAEFSRDKPKSPKQKYVTP